MTTSPNPSGNDEKGLVIGIGGRTLDVPLDVLSTPREGVVLTGRWWVVRDGSAVFWQGPKRRRGWTPQCNSDRRLPESLVDRYPGSTVKFVPAAYLGREDEEWGYLLTAVILAMGTALPARGADDG